MSHSLTLVWLRRDLRLHDHAALAEALSRPGMIQPVFVFDTEILARFADPADRRLSFIARQLARLHGELVQRGGCLLVLHGKANEVMSRLYLTLEAGRIVAAEDAEPASRVRDKIVAARTEMTTVWDHLLLPPKAVLKDNGMPLRVFTPYYQRWLAALRAEVTAEREVVDVGRYAQYGMNQALARAAGLAVLDAASPEAMLEMVGYRLSEDALWLPRQADALLDALPDKLAVYKSARDMLAEEGTSKLSPYLRFGMVSVRECARLARGHQGAEKWLSELAWRDFYAMILYHHPEVVEQEFQPRFRGLAWENNEEYFTRWREGRTGYPVVDAAMRQLLAEGWMHNRARMIVASFLTKDLLIDWRRGEEHFAQHLMDYDLASNNGGWQWAASTGTDAQPWFRIFNPVLQGRKFDPQGAYVRRYLPQLRDVPDAYIQEPWRIKGGVEGYPSRIVEHHAVREKALELFKAAK